MAYDGTDYSGWQIQPGEATIQGSCRAALGRWLGERPLPQGSGRTDAGVHALGQVASFQLEAPIPPDNLRRALNRTLPAAIRVLRRRWWRRGFMLGIRRWPRRMSIACFRKEPPGGEALVPAVSGAVCIRLSMAAGPGAAEPGGCGTFVGTHDFLSFAATDPDLAARAGGAADEGGIAPEPAVRTIFASGWEEQGIRGGNLLVYRVRGNGFLHHMVRNLVGTMLDVGRGYCEPERSRG